MSREPQTPPDECAQCGAAIPRRARACPGCGADERTGWRETSIYDGLELPEDDPDGEDDTSVGRRTPSRRTVGGLAWYWWVVSVTLLFGLGLGVLGLLR